MAAAANENKIQNKTKNKQLTLELIQKQHHIRQDSPCGAIGQHKKCYIILEKDGASIG